MDDAEMDKVITFVFRNGNRFFIELFTLDDPMPNSWDYIRVRCRTSPATDSNMALVSIKSWLANCIITHGLSDGLCNSPEFPPLPLRVVDVGLEDGVVRLVEPQEGRGKYVCLSHCWGGVHLTMTTLATLAGYKNLIAWNSLSPTFRDAISLVRRLGIRYIWIDSLCMIQDDIRDWETESSKMASIYRNSHFTIAATHSPNGEGGLFQATPDFRVSGESPDGEQYCLYFREKIDHHIESTGGYDSRSGYPTAVYYPLLTRAWVYQERMLSTRVIHFGRYEVFFECHSGVECECNRISEEDAEGSYRALIKIEHASTLSYYDFGRAWRYYSTLHYRCAALWRTIVLCYTSLLLTKSTDRLPAIGGMARDMAARRKSNYLAGLWEESLLDDLIWVIAPASNNKRPRPHPRNAPTWSWASVESPIRYWDEILYTDREGDTFAEDRLPYKHFCKVENCEVKYSAVDEFGRLSHGFLTISGLVMEGVLEYGVEQHGSTESLSYCLSFLSKRIAMWPDYLIGHPGPGETRSGTRVLCLRMGMVQEGMGYHIRDSLVSLVLKESTAFPGFFERIGTIVITAKPPPIDPLGGIFGDAYSRTVTIV
ncbi:heterokaryon incompatibility protein-domain-containing protein [Aspergillus cavernicola]|uniref:Heterokaryon incompatibility protein-domain-containing protein n=1 Tax=Aspergillus cavernicola TaxID=176166 RepID=A0ABR4J2P7_9EURO